MKAFASWSGGKDCMLAVHRFNKQTSNAVLCLINMCNEDASVSRSHGISSELVKQQADCMQIPIMQVAAGRTTYREKFISSILELKKKEGVTAGIFGDIYLKEHKVWIEALCDEIGIDAVFPLWGDDTEDLLNEFITEGFKSMVVAIDSRKLEPNYLGRVIDTEFLADLKKLEGVDVCAEQGEYHSFVFDGPNFKKPLVLDKKEIYNIEHNTFIKIEKHA